MATKRGKVFGSKALEKKLGTLGIGEFTLLASPGTGRVAGAPFRVCVVAA